LDIRIIGEEIIMEDNLVAEIKRKQMNWMRERRVDIEKQGMEGMSPGDMVNELTSKITAKMPKPQIGIEKAIASEKDTNVCSICFEIMLPKLHSPILLFPCGHTFCKQCVETSLKTGNKKCPWCRATITSHAINLSLQTIIVAYAKQNNINVQEEPEVLSDNYDEQLEMYELRKRILMDEKGNNNDEIRAIQMKIEDEEYSAEILKREEKKVLKTIELAEKELDLVREHIRKAAINIDKLYKDLETKEKSNQLIEETLIPVERERKKILTLMRIKK
jgi:hypothetical protein